MKNRLHSLRRTLRLSCACAALCFGGLTLLQAATFGLSHRLYDQVLQAHVKDARVDYAGLKVQRRDLDLYLARVASVSRRAFDGWDRRQQLAFLINAYNAFTLQLVIDHYPVKSIKDIGGLFSGPWDQEVVRLFGTTQTLNTLEHKVLRVEFAEPRIHFALVCAAMGCPPLRNEAYTAGRLEEQLDDQARRFLANDAKNRVDVAKRTVYLSPILKWYGEDFGRNSGDVLTALRAYWPAAARAAVQPDFKVRYTDYDWSLNNRHR